MKINSPAFLSYGYNIHVTIEFHLKYRYSHTIVPKQHVPTLNIQIFDLGGGSYITKIHAPMLQKNR